MIEEERNEQFLGDDRARGKIIVLFYSSDLSSCFKSFEISQCNGEDVLANNLVASHFESTNRRRVRMSAVVFADSLRQ